MCGLFSSSPRLEIHEDADGDAIESANVRRPLAGILESQFLGPAALDLLHPSSSSQQVQRVNQTVGNRYRSNRSAPVPVWSGMKPVQIQNLNLNSNKMKKFQKIPKNTTRCEEYNDVKLSQKFVHLA